ncbi:MAG: methyltransferase domain-containing protein [bacterium]|nr:methyltransferase domain-containing protein [bacterium]
MNRKPIYDYYATLESRWGYILLLKGNRHFGYYPRSNSQISFSQAQKYMEKKLAEKLDLPTNSYVLDAGCGEGNTAIFLAKHNAYKILGVDLLPISIKRAEEKAREADLDKATQFRIGDYSKLNYTTMFDGIYTMETLVHVDDYQNALSVFYKALKPGGRLTLFEYSLTDMNTMKENQKKLWNNIVEGTGMYGLPQFIHGQFPRMLKKAGFMNISTEEITERVMPMLKRFYQISFLPYKLIEFLKLEKKFINMMFAVRAYEDIVQNQTWKYMIITANKPK